MSTARSRRLGPCCHVCALGEPSGNWMIILSKVIDGRSRADSGVGHASGSYPLAAIPMPHGPTAPLLTFFGETILLSYFREHATLPLLDLIGAPEIGRA